MADTKDLKNLVEPYVRQWLQQEYGVPLEDEETPLKLTTGGTHRFDAVSKDRSIVAAVKTSKLRPSGRVGVGAVKSTYTELYFLTLIEAKYKILVLTDRGFYEYFLRRSEGRVAPDIEIRHCELPDDLAKRVSDVWASASREIGKRDA